MYVPESSTDWIVWKYAGGSSEIEKKRFHSYLILEYIFIIHTWASCAWNTNSNTYSSFYN